MYKIYPNTNLSSFKIVIASLRKKKIKQIVEILNKKIGNLINITIPNPRMIEITRNNVNKGGICKYIIDSLNYKKSDCAALGDSDNDISMFKEVALPIAIKPKNKEVLKYVKYSINKFHGGVATALIKYIIS